MTAAWKLFLFSLAIGVFAAAYVWHAKRELQSQSIDTYSRGYEAGLVDGMRVPHPDEATDCIAEAPLPDELSALAACRASFDDYRRTEAANRANARVLGLNDGLRLGREDWRVQSWECVGGISPAAVSGAP